MSKRFIVIRWKATCKGAEDRIEFLPENLKILQHKPTWDDITNNKRRNAKRLEDRWLWDTEIAIINEYLYKEVPLYCGNGGLPSGVEIGTVSERDIKKFRDRKFEYSKKYLDDCKRINRLNGIGK